MNLKDTYNRIGEDWFRDHEADDWWQKGTDFFVSLLKPKAEVLDAGCGGGTASRYLLDKGLTVTGVDFSEKMVEIARRVNPKGNFSVLDLNDLDSLQKQFAGVYARAVLLHFPKKRVLDIVKKLQQKVLPGGYLYAAVKQANPGQQEEQVKVERDYGYDYERFFSFFFPDEVKGYFTECGFEIVYSDLTKTNVTTWIQVIGKRPL